MTYTLSDQQLSELVLLTSVADIVKTFPEYAPTGRTIYRRLEKYGIKKPREARNEFKRQLLLAAPPNVSDADAQALIDLKVQAMLEELRASIFSEAREHEERFGK